MSYIGKTCPYCQTPIKPGQMVKCCEKCKIFHHSECWDDNDGCTTYGCDTKIGLEQAEELYHCNLASDVVQSIDSPINETPGLNVEYSESSTLNKTVNEKVVYILLSLIVIIATAFIIINTINNIQAKNEYNTGVAMLKQGNLDRAYIIFRNNSTKYERTDIGALSAQYAKKIENYKELSSEVISLNGEIEQDELFYDGTLIVLYDYLENAYRDINNSQTFGEIIGNSGWERRCEKYYDYVVNLSSRDRSYFSSREYDELLSAFACYRIIYSGAYLYVYTYGINSYYKDLVNEAFDKFNYQNYPYISEIIENKIKNYQSKQENLYLKMERVKELKQELDSCQPL